MSIPGNNNIDKPFKSFGPRSSTSKLIDKVRQLNDFYNFSPVGFLTLDKNALILDVNLTADILLGVARSQIVGESFYPYVISAHRDRLFHHLRSIFKRQKPQVCELQLKANGGQIHRIYMKSILDRDLQGRPACRALLVEIGERELSDEDSRRLEAQNRHTQSQQSLVVLAGGIAHNFNNILQGILGNAELAMIESPPDSPVNDYLAAVKNASQRAAGLCRQMLAYAGRANLTLQPLDVSVLADEMVPLLKKLIAGTATLQCRIEKNLPFIAADATLTRQLIMDLITNAAEAIGENDGLISLAIGVNGDQPYPRGITQMEDLPEGEYVMVEVRDTGCGMEPATRDRIFEPFFTTKFIGRGLGLASAAGIVRAHGGAIKVYSRPGRGTTFRVFLPAAG